MGKSRQGEYGNADGGQIEWRVHGSLYSPTKLRTPRDWTISTVALLLFSV